VAQHDWMIANPGKVMSVLHLTSLKYAVIQASFTARNIIAAITKNLYGNCNDLTSVTRISSYQLLQLWKEKFVTKRNF